jgi:hypothetical protein
MKARARADGILSTMAPLSRLSQRAATVVAAALIAACGTSPAPPAPPGAQVQAGRAGSWMANGLEQSDLLYVDDDANGRVDVFTYPQGKAVGEIDDLDSDGLCSDKRGNIYIPGFEESKILEFAHGGTQPIATLEMTGYEFPVSCAVDPATGDLAVTTDNGDVGVFKHAKNAPAYYYYDGVLNTWYCAYDGSGNLFVGGSNESGGFALTELPRGSSTMKLIDVPAEISVRLGIQWDGKYLAIEAEQDFHSAILLRVSVSGSKATVVGRTKLAGAPNDIGTQFWLGNGGIVQPENDNSSVGFWKYPVGGKATKSLQNLGGDLFALTVSYGRKK